MSRSSKPFPPVLRLPSSRIWTREKGVVSSGIVETAQREKRRRTFCTGVRISVFSCSMNGYPTRGPQHETQMLSARAVFSCICFQYGGVCRCCSTPAFRLTSTTGRRSFEYVFKPFWPTCPLRATTRSDRPSSSGSNWSMGLWPLAPTIRFTFGCRFTLPETVPSASAEEAITCLRPSPRQSPGRATPCAAHRDTVRSCRTESAENRVWRRLGVGNSRALRRRSRGPR